MNAASRKKTERSWKCRSSSSSRVRTKEGTTVGQRSAADWRTGMTLGLDEFVPCQCLGLGSMGRVLIMRWMHYPFEFSGLRAEPAVGSALSAVLWLYARNSCHSPPQPMSHLQPHLHTGVFIFVTASDILEHDIAWRYGIHASALIDAQPRSSFSQILLGRSIPAFTEWRSLHSRLW